SIIMHLILFDTILIECASVQKTGNQKLETFPKALEPACPLILCPPPPASTPGGDIFPRSKAATGLNSVDCWAVHSGPAYSLPRNDSSRSGREFRDSWRPNPG